MDTQSKLDILSRDAQYDLSCACSTKNPEEHRKRSSTGSGWLYPTTTASGGPGIMLKTLWATAAPTIASTVRYETTRISGRSLLLRRRWPPSFMSFRASDH